MKKLVLSLVAAALLAATVAVPLAYAHGGHDAIRTRNGCRDIPKRWHHLRDECFACIDRGQGHHFHPSLPDGGRCHR